MRNDVCGSVGELDRDCQVPEVGRELLEHGETGTGYLAFGAGLAGTGGVELVAPRPAPEGQWCCGFIGVVGKQVLPPQRVEGQSGHPNKSWAGLLANTIACLRPRVVEGSRRLLTPACGHLLFLQASMRAGCSSRECRTNVTSRPSSEPSSEICGSWMSRPPGTDQFRCPSLPERRCRECSGCTGRHREGDRRPERGVHPRGPRRARERR